MSVLHDQDVPPCLLYVTTETFALLRHVIQVLHTRIETGMEVRWCVF